MPRKSAKKQQRKKVKQSVKKAGMMSALKKLTSRKTFEEKLYDDIFDLLNHAKPKGNSQKESLANFILKKNEKKNSKNPNYKFKSELYKISNKISMLEVTNPNKLPLLSTLKNTLKNFLGETYTIKVMAKLSAPALQSSRNNVELADAFADLDFSNATEAQNRALRNVNSRLNNTNRAAAAFLDPSRLTTRTTNNDFEEVIYSEEPTVSRATNVNQSKVSNLLKQAQNEALLELELRLPSVPNTKPRAKGGYRKIKKSRKRVYA